MTIDGSRRVVQHTGDTRSYVTRQIGGETLIVPVAGSVTDLESIYVLNEVGSRIWALLRSPIAVGEIGEVVAREFEISAERAAEDVAEFLEVLGARGLVQHVAEPT